MRITIIGSGYVGLVTGACLAEVGHDVVCHDKDEKRIARLLRGEIPIYEPGLDRLVERNVGRGRLLFTDRADVAHGTPGQSFEHDNVTFACVGTPPSVVDDGAADVSQVVAAAEEFAARRGSQSCRTHKTLFVVKSTVPPGTCKKIERIVCGAADVVSNPEFLAEGRAVADFMRPDRIVVGARAGSAFEVIRGVYKPFVKSGAPIVEMKTESAEMAKYASNAHLAVRVSLMNELAHVCDRVGADVEDVRRGVGPDRRIGREFLHAGVGFGGSCFPKDLRALRAIGASELVGAALRVNDGMPETFARKTARALGASCLGGDSLAGKRIGVWGLSFKPDTDDVREAPAVKIVSLLLAAGASVRAYDPEAGGEPLRCDRYERVESPDAAAIGADALLVLTEWQEFKYPDFERLRETMRAPVVGDGRNLYDPDELRALGFDHFSVGRGGHGES